MTTIMMTGTIVVECVPCTVQMGDRRKIAGKKHKLVANSDGLYECEYCDHTSKNKSTISEHITRLHAEEAGRLVMPFDCHNCDKRFASRTSQSHHVKTFHEIEYTACPHSSCTYRAKNSAAMCTHFVNKHMNLGQLISVCDDDRNVVVCNGCNKKMKPTSGPYHVAKCSTMSPFFDENNVGDTIVFKPRKSATSKK